MANMYEISTLNLGPLVCVERPHLLVFGDQQVLVGLHHAYNTRGLIGSEINGLFVIDHYNRRVLAKGKLPASSGYNELPPRLYQQLNQLLTLNWGALCNKVQELDPQDELPRAAVAATTKSVVHPLSDQQALALVQGEPVEQVLRMGGPATPWLSTPSEQGVLAIPLPDLHLGQYHQMQECCQRTDLPGSSMSLPLRITPAWLTDVVGGRVWKGPLPKGDSDVRQATAHVDAEGRIHWTGVGPDQAPFETDVWTLDALVQALKRLRMTSTDHVTV